LQIRHRLSDYDQSPDYGDPEPSWREVIFVFIVIALVVAGRFEF
jgi:hypothetical protein